MSSPLRNPNHIPRRKAQPQKQRSVKRVRKLKKKQEVEVVRFDTRRYRIPFRVIFTVILIFAGGLGTAYSFAYLQDMRQQIDRQHVAIQQQRESNYAARAEFASNISIEEVSRIASERLNMAHPDPSQIVRIYVPRQSYVDQSYEPPPQPPHGMWQSALWYMRNWLGV